MGRTRKPITQTASGRPAGPRWVALRQRLFAQWGPAPPCYYCFHPVFAGEVAHIISPAIRPDLAWNPANLRPSHGSGHRRCPDCHLSCNWCAHNSPIAPRGPSGESLPFTPELIPKLQKGLRRRPQPPPAPEPEPESRGRDW